MDIIYTQELDKLMALQKKDRRINSMREEMDLIPLKIAEIEKDMEAKKDLLEEARKRVLNLQVKSREMELLIKEKEENVLKHQKELNAVKNNEAYKAILTEIERIKNGIDSLENDEISLLDELEEAQKAERKRKGEFMEMEKGKRQEIDALRKRSCEIENVLKGEMESRREMALKISAQLLEKYEYLRSKKGEALVEAEERDGKYFCSGCNMALTSKKSGELRKPNVIAICDNCQRMLCLKVAPGSFKEENEK